MVVRRPLSLLALTVVFSISTTLVARFSRADAQPDETLPGFHANDVLFSGTYDNVSAFSGDDNVVIPLGPAYRLGKDFQYQLKAFNSLKLWYLVATAGPARCRSAARRTPRRPSFPDFRRSARVGH